MRCNEEGLELIKSFEGFKAKAYKDIVGVPTIGYGFTSGVKMGDTMTREEAELRLIEEIEKIEPTINGLLKVDLTDNQFSALVSFCYNLGTGAFKKSTLLKKLNMGDLPGAAAEFMKWNKAGGKEVSGLTRRRKAEQALFSKCYFPAG